jgi:SOS-response transcriptional repressor LexA
MDLSMVDPAASTRSLYPGDLVLIDPLRKPTAGSTVLAEIGDDIGIVVRKLRIIAQADDGMLQHVQFIPLNPDFPTVEGPGSCILGVRAGMFRPEPENP